MPIYAYRCSTCGHAQDVLQKISDPLLSVCPACGAQTYVKQVTAAGFQLKGSGWYVTDFRGGNTAAKKDAEPGADKAADAGAEKAGGDKAVEKTADKSAEKSAEKSADKRTAGGASAAKPAAAAPSPAASPASPAAPAAGG
jgi:putative FmdB family regulatory protein